MKTTAESFYIFEVILPVLISKFTGSMNNQDKANIVEFLLQNYYIRENEALQQQVNWLQVLLFDKNKELREAGEVLNDANARIASMQSDILYYQRVIAAQRRNERILIDRQGNSHVFRRNRQGAFVPEDQVDSDSTDSEFARQLGFDDSDTESDDFMTSLMGM